MEDPALNDAARGGRPAGHDPLAAARGRDFRLYATGRLASGAAMTLFQAAIAWQVYQISGSALQLGFLGLVRFLPSLGMSLVGGAVADSYDRRRVLVLAQLVPLSCGLTLFAATRADVVGLPLIYTLVLLVALASSFENPARQALLPQLVPRDLFMNAVTLSSTIQQLAFVIGPALGGLVIARASVAGAYALHAALVLCSMLALIPLRPRPVTGERRAVSIAAIREGIRFVWRRQVLLGAMALDMFAVIFAGAQAMLPIYAEDILKVGPGGYGLLTSSQGAGALLMSVVLVLLPPIRRTGAALLLTVAAFGLFTILFGLSRSFPLSLLAYGLTGAADQVSVIMRQTTIQLSTPDELRGRVSSVSMIFIGASNQVGMIESGLVAALTNATFAVVSGGAACMAVAGIIAAKMPELRRYRIDGPPEHPPATAARAPAVESRAAPSPEPAPRRGGGG